MTASLPCQLCGGQNTRVFYEIDSVPVHSCLMLDSAEEARAFPRGSLRIAVCPNCGFIQNNAFDASVHDYSPRYEETQAFSARFREFQTGLVDSQVARHGLKDRTALEIGCGKGEFLVELCERAPCSGIGIDPGYRPERTDSPARSRIEFIQDFYSERFSHLKADYVCCRHTLEHIQPVREFLSTVRKTLQPGTPVFFELPDVERVLRQCAYEDLYYEHCTYFTRGSLARLFRLCDFTVTQLSKAFDDQYLLIEARPGATADDAPQPEEDSVEQVLEWVGEFERFAAEKIAAMRAELTGYRERGERVALWGSGSKCVSYLSTLNVTDEVSAVVDINPHKHGKFLAGTGHRIDPPSVLKDCKPTVVIVMNAIYLAEIEADLRALGLSPVLRAI